MLFRSSSSSGQPTAAAEAVVHRLREAMTVQPSPTPRDHPLGIDPEILKVLTEYEGHRLQENVKAKHYLYEIRAHFRFDDFDKALSKLTTKLQSAGEVITTLPCSGMSSKDGIGFTLLVGSKRDREGLAQLLADEAVELVAIGGHESAPSKVLSKIGRAHV